MEGRLWLRLDAPFGVSRTFSAGWYRPTAEFVSHSSAYGLLLNVAGIESRLWEGEEGHDAKTPASLTRNGLPLLRIALGIPEGYEAPRIETIYQQLHNYPKDRNTGLSPEMAKGRKNNITPVRREVLRNVHAVLVVEASHEFVSRLRRGLNGDLKEPRYGLPFIGDNSFLPDRLAETSPSPARWYARVVGAQRPTAGTTRLTSCVDRAGMADTVSALFAPSQDVSLSVPELAWVEVGG